jgi:hypothetical protein
MLLSDHAAGKFFNPPVLDDQQEILPRVGEPVDGMAVRGDQTPQLGRPRGGFRSNIRLLLVSLTNPTASSKIVASFTWPPDGKKE